ncbi:MAG: LysR substrate-binding domain-containing protein [Burkholderiaceae bacterium]
MPIRLDDITWARRLKLRHLEILLVLCEARSITAAAEELHMTQPAVSHWLADIEELVGMPLFVRGRQLRATPAGEVLRRHAERMLGDVHRTGEELVAVGKGLAGRLRVGSIVSAVPALLPMAIGRLQDEFPSLHIHVVETTFERLLERLRKKELDLIIGPLDLRAQRSGFQSELLIADTVAIVTSPGHPFARKRRPTWREAAELPWIMPPVGTLIRQQVEAAFLQAGVIAPPARIETASHVVVQMLLRRGAYISALAGSAAPIYAGFKLMDIVKLTPRVMFGDIGMLWDPQDLEPRLLKLIATLREEAEVLRSAEASDR